MKKSLSILTIVLCASIAYAQNAPQMFNYQGVARDNGGNVLANQSISLRISLREDAATGPLLYMEDHAVVTNNFGLFNLQIGNGTPVVSSFSNVAWNEHQYWLDMEMDPAGGASFQALGVSQMVSVPYALYAESSGASLDDAYNAGGLGNGRTIEAYYGAVKVEGTDGLLVTGTHGSGADIEVSGAGTRMFFNPKKSAFRAGTVIGTEWDEASIGEYSTSTGYRSVASGTFSVAIGEQCNSIGEAAVAMGSETNAIGQHAISLGYYTVATGDISVAIGSGANAGGEEAVALGSNSFASGDKSFAVGPAAQAMGLNSVAIGDHTVAGGSNAFAFGKDAETSAGNAFAFGNTAVASAAHAFAIGNEAEATGNHAIAFGQAAEAYGSNSFAHGVGSKALSGYTIAIGSGAEASGSSSIAIGSGARTTQDAALALGTNVRSEAEFATAIGYSAEATGELSFAAGNQVEASSQGEFVVGQYNTLYTPNNQNVWDPSDRQFVVGNGTGVNRSDAMVILKNGQTGISISNPTAMLHVADGNVIFDRNQDGSAISRSLTLSGKRSGNGNHFASLEFRNQDDNTEYLGSAIRSFNGAGFEDGDLRFYVRDGLNGFLTEGLRITHEADVYVPKAGSAIIMKSPNGTCWHLTVSNAGVLGVVEALNCP